MKDHIINLNTEQFTMDTDLYRQSFARDGFYVCENAISIDEVVQQRTALQSLPDSAQIRRKRGVYGVRNLLEICSDARILAGSQKVRQFVTPILGDHAFAVRAILFDKIPDANWSLFWHQDSVIAVDQRADIDGFVAWSQKSGVWQVQPPADVLAKMVAVRIHLDDCDQTNGPLRVLPGSHRHGWLDDELDDWKANVPEIICTVGCGGVVVMCPLTLHASAPSRSPIHRRVIHIEYAADELPAGIDWHTRIGVKVSQTKKAFVN